MRKYDPTRMQMALSRKRPLPQEEQAEPKRKKSRKNKPGLGDEIFKETVHYIQNGLRYVRPYYFSFTSHAKGRWVGSCVYDIFCREFQAERPEYYEKAIKAGKVKVNSEPATMETVLQHNDLLVHRVHRHEPPVTAQPITILYQDNDIVAINKPPSIPVHPCGRYRHNSVVFLLGKEHNLTNLHTLHRLDRLTSGLLLFARNLPTAQRLEQQIRDRQVAKEYVCKVHGEFPNESVVCTEPILIVTHKLGICRVDPAGKTCSTCFTRLSTDGQTSILRCEPRTGRMHQIRVHLQWLGHPIVNDPLYGHPAWGPQRGRKGEGVRNIDEVIKEIVESNYNSEQDAEERRASDVKGSLLSMSTNTITDSTEQQKKCAVNAVSLGGEEVKDDLIVAENDSVCDPNSTECGHVNPDLTSYRDPECTECGLVYPDPTPDQLIMYLHALSYRGPDWEYSTKLPSWAQSGKDVTSPSPNVTSPSPNTHNELDKSSSELNSTL